MFRTFKWPPYIQASQSIRYMKEFSYYFFAAFLVYFLYSCHHSNNSYRSFLLLKAIANAFLNFFGALILFPLSVSYCVFRSYLELC